MPLMLYWTSVYTIYMESLYVNKKYKRVQPQKFSTFSLSHSSSLCLASQALRSLRGVTVRAASSADVRTEAQKTSLLMMSTAQ